MKLQAIVAGIVLLPGLAHAAAPGEKSELEFMDDSYVICEYEATTRGVLDGGRLQYCLANHRRWLAEVVTLDGKHQAEFYTDHAYPYCYGRGTKRDVSNIGTIALCLRTEIDAFEDLAYYAHTVGRDLVIPIIERNMVKYGSWNMARYEVRNKFDPRP